MESQAYNTAGNFQREWFGCGLNPILSKYWDNLFPQTMNMLKPLYIFEKLLELLRRIVCSLKNGLQNGKAMV